jgi:hypothetical protein
MLKNSSYNKVVILWETRKLETIEEFYKRKFNWVPVKGTTDKTTSQIIGERFYRSQKFY